MKEMVIWKKLYQSSNCHIGKLPDSGKISDEIT